LFISYAQNFEDVLLWRALGDVKDGFYVDIGAQHPTVDSVSLAFHERGWRGVHVEPDVEWAGRLRECRPGDTVIEAAVGLAKGESSFFEIDGTGFSTCDPGVAAAHRAAGRRVKERRVRMVTLGEVLDGCGAREIHWLKIDVEGFESQVLRGWPPSLARPWVLVVESVLPENRTDTSREWEHILLELGYMPVYYDGLNRYFVATSRSSLARFFDCGPNVFDDFALSGQSSASFCSALNDRVAADHRAYREVLEEQRETLTVYADNLKGAHAAEKAAWDAERASTKEYVNSIFAWGKESEAYAKSLEAERVQLYAAQQAAQQRIATLEEELAKCRMATAKGAP